MVQKRFYNIEELAVILGKSIASIHGHLARKQYDAVPPPIKLGRKLAWPVETADTWISNKIFGTDKNSTDQSSNTKSSKKRRGRPRKSELKDGADQ